MSGIKLFKTLPDGWALYRAQVGIKDNAGGFIRDYENAYYMGVSAALHLMSWGVPPLEVERQLRAASEKAMFEASLQEGKTDE